MLAGLAGVKLGLAGMTKAAFGWYIGKTALTAGVATVIEAGVASYMDDDSFSWGGAALKNFAVDFTIGWLPGVAETRLSAKAGRLGIKLLGYRIGFRAGRAVGRYGLHYGSEVAASTIGDTAWAVGIEGRGFRESFTQSLVGNLVSQPVGDVASAAIRRSFGKVIAGTRARFCFVAGTPVVIPGEGGLATLDSPALANEWRTELLVAAAAGFGLVNVLTSPPKKKTGRRQRRREHEHLPTGPDPKPKSQPRMLDSVFSNIRSLWDNPDTEPLTTSAAAKEGVVR